MKEITLIILGIVAGFLFLITAVFGLVIGLLFMISPIKTAQCEGFAGKSGYAGSYQWYSNTCFLEIDGKWIPKSVWVNNTGN